MLEQGFLKERGRSSAASRRGHIGSLASKFFIRTGIAVLAASFFVLLLKFRYTDTILAVWIPFAVLGSVMVIIGGILRLTTKQKETEK